MYDSRYAIRCANGNTVWTVADEGRYGINVLAEIKVENEKLAMLSE